MKRKSIAAALVTTLLASPAMAADYLGVYGGYFDVTQDDNSAAQMGIEYRFDDVYRGLRPAVGANVSTDGALYGYGGFFWDVFLTNNVIFTPNVVAGLYEDGDGKDLGHTVQFRSGLELSYQFEQQNRLGVAFNHISNASLGNRNPGAETLLLIYQHPLQ